MVTRRAPKNRTRPRTPNTLHKPAGDIQDRVQAVGPEHFGIVAIDCAKARCKWLLADFYGKILVPPTTLPLLRPDLDLAIAHIRAAAGQHQLRDLLIALERTGRYHHIPRRALAAAGLPIRIVHPLVSRHFRQPQHAGLKTDDNDLAAIFRAAANGFALTEPELPESYRILQLLTRHRRDLVCKSSKLRCQIQEHLEAVWPGFGDLFEDLWRSPLPLTLLCQYDSADALRTAGLDGLDDYRRGQGLHCKRPTLKTILDWAALAPPADPDAAWHRRLALDLEADRTRKDGEIQAAELDACATLVGTPYVLLLSIPGIGVVTAADFAAEMGPIEHYADAKAITGRAGLFPSRYQSDTTDRSGPLVRRANRRLRAAILAIADNLLACNAHFRVLAAQWQAAGKSKKHNHVKVALRFCRIAYRMVSGRQVYRHPAQQERHYVLQKLIAFQHEHDTPVVQCQRELMAAASQVPASAHAAEAVPLQEELKRIESGKRRGPQVLAEILPMVLARLGIGGVESTESGESAPR
jgi:transposase